jgi:hypothetical protein
MDGIGGHSTVTNTSRYTARYPGWYRCGGGVMFVPSATGRRGASWAVNGTLLNGVEAIWSAASANETGVPARSVLVFLNAGDFVELFGFQNAGAGLSTAVASSQQPSAAITWESN